MRMLTFSMLCVLSLAGVACDRDAGAPKSLPTAGPTPGPEAEAPAKAPLTEKQVEAKVLGVIARQLNVPVGGLAWATRLRSDLGVDDLDLVEIVMELEDEFEIKISDEAAEKWQTVGQVIGHVRSEVVPGIKVPDVSPQQP